MKFQDLPKDAQHHALSTLRDLITAGCRKETELELAGVVKAAFASMYADNSANEEGMAEACDATRHNPSKVITPLHCGGVNGVYHETMVKALRMEIAALEEKLKAASPAKNQQDHQQEEDLSVR